MYVNVYDKKTKQYIGVRNLHSSATEEDQWNAAVSLAQTYRSYNSIRTIADAKEKLLIEVGGV